jgi:hypothetical protein
VMAFVTSIANNALANTTASDARTVRIRSTTPPRGNDYGLHSWRRICCAGHANRQDVSEAPRPSTTLFPSSKAARPWIGTICSPFAGPATRGSQQRKEVAGTTGRGLISLGLTPKDRRVSRVCISAKCPTGGRGISGVRNESNVVFRSHP